MAPANTASPSLPPSVEEAYRRKCIQLRQRTQEVEEANDAARLRIDRMKRQVEKMRLERAFLLQQLELRTSTNVEDSDGSPSPPPTPKERPLRIKRGHRKSAAASTETPPPAAGSTFIKASMNNLSPVSDAYSHNTHAEGGKSEKNGTNGMGSEATQRPPTAFELYCEEARPNLEVKFKEAAQVKEDDDGKDVDNHKDALRGPVNVEDELEHDWEQLPEAEKNHYVELAADKLKSWETARKKEGAAKETVLEKEAEVGDRASEVKDGPRDAVNAAPSSALVGDEDVEMTNYDTEDEK